MSWIGLRGSVAKEPSGGTACDDLSCNQPGKVTDKEQMIKETVIGVKQSWLVVRTNVRTARHPVEDQIAPLRSADNDHARSNPPAWCGSVRATNQTLSLIHI